MTSFLAGLRAKELAALKRSDVQAPDGTLRGEFVLTAMQTKRRKSCRVFVSNKLRREAVTAI